MVASEDDHARDLRTVFVSQIAQRVREADVYDFFAKAGRVRDVRLIMDRMSSKHKGAGYVEFYDKESVAKAVVFDGTVLGRFPIAVKPTAEQTGSAVVRAPESSTARGSPEAPSLVPTTGVSPMKAFDDSIVGWSNKYRARKVDQGNAASEVVTDVPVHGLPSPNVPTNRPPQLVSIEELKKLLNPLGLPPPYPNATGNIPSTILGKPDGSLPPQSVEQVPLPTVSATNIPSQPVSVSRAFTRLYVGSIAFQLTEADLRAIFEPFGSIASLQLQRDANGSSRGYGFVEFREHESAKKALEISGLTVAGRTLKVALASQEHRVTAASTSGTASTGAVPLPGPIGQMGAVPLPTGDVAGELDEGKDGGLAINASQRVALMQQLSRGKSIGKSSDEMEKLPVSSEVSRSVMLSNLFDPATEQKGFEMELAEDVRDECISKYGPVVHLFVEPKSQGVVFVRFQLKEDAGKARTSLNARWFGGRRIQAAFVRDEDYAERFPNVAGK